MYIGVCMLFCKMNGLGNDYIFFDSSNCNKSDFDFLKSNVKSITPKLSDRNFGIGGDGVVLVETSEVADAKMRIFNADGTEGMMCGNALRCIGKILYDKAPATQKDYFVETLSGIKHLKIIENDGSKSVISTDMGLPKLVNIVDDVEFYNVGNPHAVFYVDRLNDTAMEKAKELSSIYDVNAEAVKIDGNCISMRVWERGSGETLACGTGATCVAYSILNKRNNQNEIELSLRGGKLRAIKEKDNISLIGTANINFIGEINLDYYGKNQ